MALPNIRPLPEHLQKVAIEELNEKPERLAEDLQALKSWAAKEPHLNVRLNDQLLVGFLRGCKFSLEKAKSKLDWFYTLKTKYPDFYTIPDVTDPSVEERLRFGSGSLLPTPLHETGPRIMFIRAGNYPADKYTFKEIMAVAHALQELWVLEDDYATVNGFIDVLDISRLTAAHFAQHSPSVVKKMLVFAEKGLPLRQRATHFINIPAGFDKVFNILKPLMPAKQQERLYLHGNNLESLYAHIPQKYLPKEYGGENGSIEEITEASTKFFLDRRDYFVEDQKYRNNEKLRVGKQPDFDSIFGMEGSFRKLDVD
ncbi:alpha-tocopherol transfer protein-like [Anastrepha ludens]|uniref:alpha-tocopherol transfer protein-like n=1 Tax=Anastrepha ludens TaxID=28586 RepID=UPI0023AF6BF0|nr:alpha-tocopherol transfer protein-like [Anastrepha ludens]XP_053962516.1 alpha-tocopherol transfer protein-like [Anastrepha ludens]